MRERLKNLIASGKTDKALKLLLTELSSFDSDLQNQILLLKSQWNSIQQEKLMGTESNSNIMREQNKINFALLHIIDKLEDKNQVHQKPQPTPSASSKTIFISYNHADSALASELKQEFEKQGLKVIIDHEEMKAGEKINEFITRSIKNSDAVFSLATRKSLLSPWVGIEFIQSFFNLEFNNTKKMFVGYADVNFFDIKFQIDATKEIDKKIADINETIQQHNELKIDTQALNDDKTRLIKLRNNLGEIIGQLKSILCLDIMNLGIEQTAKKTALAIKG